MDYLGNIMSSMISTVFIIFAIMCLGYLVGRITIKGVSLGTAGVLLVALAFGIFASYVPYITIGGHHITMFIDSAITLEDGTVLSSTSGLFSLVSNIGTALFVTAVGLIAGPKFFRMFNRKSLGYILMGFIVILIGTIVAVSIILMFDDVDSSLAMGLMTGALTSTPGFSAAKEVATDQSRVAAGYGIAYLYGVIGVVLFVQLVPKILKVDMNKERQEFVAANSVEVKPVRSGLIKVDSYEFFPFALTIIFGCLIGCIEIPGINFSLGTSGGVLIAGLIIGHFRHVGPIDCQINAKTLTFMREMGLCLFLIGAGVPGGVNFISNVKVSYFVFGIIITTVPMIIGFILARYVFHMSIFNALGSITGGMTSTPALGALISTTGTEDVSSAYAATYPFALFFVVLSSRIVAGIL